MGNVKTVFDLIELILINIYLYTITQLTKYVLKDNKNIDGYEVVESDYYSVCISSKKISFFFIGTCNSRCQ